MQYSPQSWELLEAIQTFLIKEILPEVKHDDLLAYKTLISWNMLGVVSREIQAGEGLLNKELRGLIHLLNTQNIRADLTIKQKIEIANALTHELTNKIQQENIADTKSDIWQFVKESLKYKLQISNPRYSLD